MHKTKTPLIIVLTTSVAFFLMSVVTDDSERMTMVRRKNKICVKTLNLLIIILKFSMLQFSQYEVRMLAVVRINEENHFIKKRLI